MQRKFSYELMCKDRCICIIDQVHHNYHVVIPRLMPLDMDIIEGSKEPESILHNLQEFDSWCAKRVLSLERKFAKRILNELGLSQSQSIEERAKIARAYRAVSLQDSYWLRVEGEAKQWKEISLFANHLSSIMVPVALCGSSLTLQQKRLAYPESAAELSTIGTYAKAWLRDNGKLEMLKADDNLGNETLREVYASNIASAFNVDCVKYRLSKYDNCRVSICDCITNEDIGIVRFSEFRNYCIRYHKDPIEEVKKIDAENYYKMNIIMYLIGNSDNHDQNWGFYRDMNTGELLRVHPIFDLNCSFDEMIYFNEDGGVCLPTLQYRQAEEDDPFSYEYVGGITALEAALEAANHVQILQQSPIFHDWFLSKEYEKTFIERCARLGISIKISDSGGDLRSSDLF